MNHTLHATFPTAQDGLRAAEALLYDGVHADDINLILPRPSATCAAQTSTPYEPLTVRQPPAKSIPATVLDTEEGAGLGLVFGLLTAMCVPGIGMIAGSGYIVAGLVAAGAAAGGLAGGIYGYLVDRNVAHELAIVLSKHLEAGDTTLSVTISDPREENEIIRVIKVFGGCIIPSP